MSEHEVNTAAHHSSYPMGNKHHGTPERPDWGTFCVECKDSWPCDVSLLAARLADAEARAEAARGKVEEAIAEFEVLASKMRPSAPTWDHAPISGYVISADDWRAIRAHLREALRGDQ